MSTDGGPTQTEIDELVSHVLALRKDFVEDLMRSEGIPFNGLRKLELRDRLREAIAEGEIAVDDVIGFLDEVEPGGKQHVFMLRAPKTLNDRWRDPAVARRRLQKEAGVRGLLNAALPLMMPPELQLSRVRLEAGLVEIVAVEARRYFERDTAYDREELSDDGLRVELRAHVERVARSTVALRWNTATRHAALHITQASSSGLKHDHYRDVAQRFAAALLPWLDFAEFKRINLAKVLHELHGRERTHQNALTKSRRGRWETSDGSELEAIGASGDASFFEDEEIKAAVGQVETPASAQSGNMRWLPDGTGPLTGPLHLMILAYDTRVNFMVPSSPQEVDYVLEQIRRLL
jgi:hypothetical protein